MVEVRGVRLESRRQGELKDEAMISRRTASCSANLAFKVSESQTWERELQNSGQGY